MSRASKPRDRWSQVFSTAHERSPLWCTGCGYWRVVHGRHRGDCTAQSLHDKAVATVLVVLGGRILYTESYTARRTEGRTEVCTERLSVSHE